MEKKSIGNFISALRKANGMTQKQLAEKLGVSDKAVSRWERDECAPDLTLIPVLAEIFGVTSDEILRGERQNPDVLPAASAEVKKERQIENIMKGIKTRFSIRTLISAGITVAGIVAILICNFAFLRGEIGFYLGMVFYAAAIICEIGFLINAFSSFDSDEVDETDKFKYKYPVVKLSVILICTVVSLFIGALPFAACSYCGLNDIVPCILYFIIALAVCAVIGLIVVLSYKAKALKSLGDEAEKTQAYIKHVKKTSILAAILLGVTFLGQFIFNISVEPQNFAAGKSFDNSKDFIEYMETPVGYTEVVMTGSYSYGTISEEIDENEINTDENISYDSFIDENGNEVQYQCNNMAVTCISYEHKDGKFKATCYTDEDIAQGNIIINNINIRFLILYFIELAIVVFFYIKGKNKALTAR